MQPTEKSPHIDALLTAFTGKSRHEVIASSLCMTCGANPIPEFTDQLSITEYTISGMCQTCQDSVFGVDPFDISRDYGVDKP